MRGNPPHVGVCLATGWARFRDHPWTLILMAGVFWLILFAGAAPALVYPAIAVIPLLLQGPLILGLFRVLRDVHGGGDPAWERLFSGFRDIGPALLNGTVYMVLCLAGYAMCGLPGLLLSGLAIYWPLCLDDQGMSTGLAPLVEAKALAMPFLGPSMLVALVANAIMLAGALLCVVPVIVATPVAMIALVHAYETMRGAAQYQEVRA